MTDMSNFHASTFLQERADFYLILARSFMTPITAEHFQAMNDLLADDLADLDQTLTYGIGPQLDALHSAFAKLSSYEELLVEYSRMFLQPPREAPLNVCYPLDGAMMGGTVSEIEDFYRKFGIERGDHFKDLPDHVSVQLEFISYLYGLAAEEMANGKPDTEAEKAARHFLHEFVSRWAPHFEAGVEKAGRRLKLKANPYLPLARILSTATGRDAAANPDWVKAKKRVEVAIEKARLEHTQTGITPENMAEIERILRGKGLSTDHLGVALDKRNEALGLSAKSPPDPRRK